MPSKTGEEWIHPPLEEAREDDGVCTIQHHVEKRQNRVAMCVAARPIWSHCAFTDANPDISASRIMWWTKVLPPPNPPSLPPSHTTTGPGSSWPESHAQERWSLALLGQGAARAVPALTSGEVKHTEALAMLWASPSGRGWFRTGLDT